jgi:hypothetical protein
VYGLFPVDYKLGWADVAIHGTDPGSQPVRARVA